MESLHTTYAPVAQLGEQRTFHTGEESIVEVSMLNTHFRGEITELQVAEAFLEQGYQICKPMVSDCRYDFIADINHHLYRIQVKTAKVCSNGEYIEFSTQSTHTNTKKTVYHTYSSEDVDYFATVYDGQCYLVPIDKIGSRSFKLRLKPTRNGQKTNINFADEYRLENTFIK